MVIPPFLTQVKSGFKRLIFSLKSAAISVREVGLFSPGGPAGRLNRGLQPPDFRPTAYSLGRWPTKMANFLVASNC